VELQREIRRHREHILNGIRRGVGNVRVNFQDMNGVSQNMV
jgi:hypothetical protein